MLYEGFLTLILTLIVAQKAFTLKCYSYNEVTHDPWERMAKNPDAFSVICDEPLTHFEKMKEEALTDDEKKVYASMKPVCLQAIRDLDYSPDPKFFFGECAYFKKGLHDPCKNMHENSKPVKGMRVVHCQLCATDHCNAGDPEVFNEYNRLQIHSPSNEVY